VSKSGVQGLSNLLQNLGISSVGVDQHKTNIKNVWRNKDMKGLINATPIGREKKYKGNNMYWAIFDDIGLQLSYIKGEARVVQDVKLYGEYLDIMCMGQESSEFALVDQKSEIFQICGKVAKKEMYTLLTNRGTKCASRSDPNLRTGSSIAERCKRALKRAYGSGYGGYSDEDECGDYDNGGYGGYNSGWGH
jgi:hypothetical protein